MRSVILGVGLGHDASATVLVDGVIQGHVLRERLSGVRHHYGLDKPCIRECLREAGVYSSDITQVAIASTQLMPALIDDADYFEFSQAQEDSHRQPTLFGWQMITQSARWNGSLHQGAQDFFRECAEFWSIPAVEHRNWWWLQLQTPSFGPASWNEPGPLDQLHRKLVDDWVAGASSSQMHAPINAVIDGAHVPGVFVNHHAAHAASSFYSSPFESAVIVTHDGGVGAESGHVFVAREGQLLPLGPHFLECGQFYEVAGGRLGFHYLGAAGKLMGLAGYGVGTLRKVLPSGNYIDWRDWALSKACANAGNRWAANGLYATMFDALVNEARLAGLDTTSLGVASRLPHPAASEIAYSVQQLTEDSMMDLFRQSKMAAELLFEDSPNSLCLSGGVALNCPTNTKGWNSRLFRDMHIEPHCEDGGISLGAAWFLYHGLNRAACEPRPKLSSCYAMMGRKASAKPVPGLLREFEGRLNIKRDACWWNNAAQDLAANKVIAICHGPSETGPRALGHRSILANPGFSSNWQRVNLIKGREAWRPFAPVMLQSHLRDWFEGGPDSSPFMLFNYRVLESMRHRIPAVIHADGTSRVQTVIPQDGAIFQLLEAFDGLCGLPVLMNTSFNGPKQPIVETSRQAIAFLLERNLDALYLDGLRITRRA